MYAFIPKISMLRLSGSINRYPARMSCLGFAVAIVVGSLWLLSPGIIAADRPRLSPVDAVFMSTSALCVTGLSVRSLESDYTLYGQCVMLVLIQVGGLGIMTLTTFIMIMSGIRGGMRQSLLVTSTLYGGWSGNVRSILLRILTLTLLLESVGAAMLFARLLSYMEPVAALKHAVFLSVSAFNNAGFALTDDSLIGYQNDGWVLTSIASLIVLGGLGYPVLFDLYDSVRRNGGRFWDDLHIHSKIMLIGTSILLGVGGLAIFLLELPNDAFDDDGLGGRFAVAAFQSVTTRTAGFNSVDLTRFGNATLFVMMGLMFIGAGPCSTAGGVKVSTVYMLVMHAWSRFRGRQTVSCFRRTIPQKSIDQAMAILVLSLAVAIMACIVILSTEQIRTYSGASKSDFLPNIFHVVSALATVGLAVSDISQLQPLSKCGLIALMYMGRLGPVSFFAALSNLPAKKSFQYAPEEPITG